MSTELDLGALRTLADVSAKMGYKCRLTPAELDALLAAAGERDALRAEVDACGAIIGQPPGAKGGHAEIIDATIKEHQAANAKLRAEVERLRAMLVDVLNIVREFGESAGVPKTPLDKLMDVIAAAKEVR